MNSQHSQTLHRHTLKWQSINSQCFFPVFHSVTSNWIYWLSIKWQLLTEANRYFARSNFETPIIDSPPFYALCPSHVMGVVHIIINAIPPSLVPFRPISNDGRQTALCKIGWKEVIWRISERGDRFWLGFIRKRVWFVHLQLYKIGGVLLLSMPSSRPPSPMMDGKQQCVGNGGGYLEKRKKGW